LSSFFSICVVMLSKPTWLLGKTLWGGCAFIAEAIVGREGVDGAVFVVVSRRRSSWRRVEGAGAETDVGDANVSGAEVAVVGKESR
jgi:hypothetical protein